MASFAEQIQAARSAHATVAALDSQSRVKVLQAFTDWEAGKLSDKAFSDQLQSIVRVAYRATGIIGNELVARQAGLGSWSPAMPSYNTPYVKALLKDVRKNLKAYKKSDKTEADRRAAILRIQHSAGVGAEQGYTDSVISGYDELDDYGYDLRKVWLANFVNNTPCPHCVALHGTEVPLHEQFKHPSGLKIYISLFGPPLHPNCQCFIAILIVGLENANEELNVDAPNDSVPTSMTTDDVKGLSKKIFDALRRVLKSIQKVFGKKKS